MPIKPSKTKQPKARVSAGDRTALQTSASAPLFKPETPEAVTLNQLDSHLWEAANILRGSPLDRTDWKSYILPLLFFKRICDVWDEESAEATATYGGSQFADFPEAHRFQVPDGYHWSDVRAKATNVGSALLNAMRGIEKANQKHLYGVFGDAQWTNKERLPDFPVLSPSGPSVGLPSVRKAAGATVWVICRSEPQSGQLAGSPCPWPTT